MCQRLRDNVGVASPDRVRGGYWRRLRKYSGIQKRVVESSVLGQFSKRMSHEKTMLTNMRGIVAGQVWYDWQVQAVQ